MDDLKVTIPEFLKIKTSKDDMPELYWLTKEYEEKFNARFCTEGLIMDDDEWTELLQQCLKENKTVDEMLGIGKLGEDDLI